MQQKIRAAKEKGDAEVKVLTPMQQKIRAANAKDAENEVSK